MAPVTVTFTPEVRALDATSINDFTEKNFHGLLSVVAPERSKEQREKKRPPIHLTLVIDRSGSMSGQPLKLVKKAAEYIVDQLTEDDKLAVVDYGCDVVKRFGLTQCTDANRHEMKQDLKNLATRGMTNLCGGLLEGIKQYNGSTSGVSAAMEYVGNMVSKLTAKIPENAEAGEAAVKSVFLLTDGLANVGPTTCSEIGRQMKVALSEVNSKSKSAENNPVTVHCFGFGDGHDPEMLSSLAKTGRGDFLYIENERSIGTSFGTALGGLLSTAVTKVEVSIALEETLAASMTVPSNDMDIEASAASSAGAGALPTTPGSVHHVMEMEVPKAISKQFEIEHHKAFVYNGQRIPPRIVLKLGEMFYEERRDILISFKNLRKAAELKFDKDTMESATLNIASATVSYFDLETKQTHTSSSSPDAEFVVVNRDDEMSDIGTTPPPTVAAQLRVQYFGNSILRSSMSDLAQPDVKVKSHMYRVLCLDTLATAKDKAGAGSLEEARNLVKTTSAEIQKFLDQLNQRLQTIQAARLNETLNPHVAEERRELENATKMLRNLVQDLNDCLGDMRDVSQFEAVGRKKMIWHSGSHAKQRGCGQMNNCNMNAMQAGHQMEATAFVNNSSSPSNMNPLGAFTNSLFGGPSSSNTNAFGAGMFANNSGNAMPMQQPMSKGNSNKGNSKGARNMFGW